jgi:hypothetical protein
MYKGNLAIEILGQIRTLCCFAPACRFTAAQCSGLIYRKSVVRRPKCVLYTGVEDAVPFPAGIDQSWQRG